MTPHVCRFGLITGTGLALDIFLAPWFAESCNPLCHPTAQPQSTQFDLGKSNLYGFGNNAGWVSGRSPLKTLMPNELLPTQKTKLQNNRFKECVGPPSRDGETLRGFHYFFANERMRATTALISSSESLLLNEGMNLPLPFFIVSAI